MADFIWFHLNRKNRDPSHECSKAIEIFIAIFEREEFGVIRIFLDQTLQSRIFSPSEAFCRSAAKCLAKCLSKVVKSRNRFGFLVMNLVGSRENLASLLLSIVKHVEKDVLLKILQFKSGLYDENALQYAARHRSSALVSNLCDIITTRTAKPKEIFQGKHRDYRNVLLTAAHNSHEGVLTILTAKLSSVFTKDELKIMFQEKYNDGENKIVYKIFLGVSIST